MHSEQLKCALKECLIVLASRWVILKMESNEFIWTYEHRFQAKIVPQPI